MDIILGGHDHLYFVGRGVDEWNNYNLSEHVLGAEEDNGDVLVIKSGTDFRDISEICLELKDAPEGSARKKLISRITGKCMLYRTREVSRHILSSGKHHEITPNLRSCPNLRKVLDNILESVGASLKAPLCKLAAELDVRSHLIRTQEVRPSASILDLFLHNLFNLQSASADWFADILRNTYDDALCLKGIQGGVDGVFICAGMLRGDSVYGPGTKYLFGLLVGRQNGLRRPN